MKRITPRDYWRTAAFSMLSLLALIPMWDASQVVFYFIGAISLVALYSHIARKLFFPYIDLEEFADRAKEQPVASAIVFAAVTALLCTIIFVAGSLIGFK